MFDTDKPWQLASIRPYPNEMKPQLNRRSSQVLRGGMGASWHAMETPIPVVGDRSHGGSGWGGYPPAGDDAAWRQIYRHADWLGLDFCRVEVEQRIYEPERNQFTWDSPEMKILYRILDWCERRHVDVFFQHAREHFHEPSPGAPASLPAFGMAGYSPAGCRRSRFTAAMPGRTIVEPPHGGCYGFE